MNNEQSERLIRSWNAHQNPLKRAALVVERRLDATPESIFPLLCPTREYDWIDDWECRLLHSRSGHAEFNVIFRTHLLGVEEVWVCTRYEPNREIHYLRMADGLVTLLEISLADGEDGGTMIRWSLTASALEEGMNHAVSDLEEGGRRAGRIEDLLDDLEHYLEEGEM